MSSIQIAILVLIFSAIVAAIVLALVDVARGKLFDRWVVRAPETDLRHLKSLRDTCPTWVLHTVTHGQEKPWLEVWNVQRLHGTEHHSHGAIRMRLGMDEGQWGDQRFAIFIDQEYSRARRGQLVVRNGAQPVLTWELHRRSLWQVGTQREFQLYTVNHAGKRYAIHRAGDRLELREDDITLGVVSLGGFETRVASMIEDLPSELALSLIYSALLKYDGPRVAMPRQPEATGSARYPIQVPTTFAF